jgi:hypothetical protein
LDLGKQAHTNLVFATASPTNPIIVRCNTATSVSGNSANKFGTRKACARVCKHQNLTSG